MNESLNDGPQGNDVAGQLAGALPRVVPPPGLEARLEHSLVSAGLLARPRRSSRRMGVVAALAAGVMCFALGVVVGSARVRSPAAAAPDRAPKFALLLYGDPADSTHSPNDVQEHVRWAQQLARDGHQISGEKLGGDVRLLMSDSSESDARLQGFFVISAASDAEAITIARSSPHFRHGGRVVVRRIEPT